MITDWSGVATEFCFATKRPAVFINTKMKCPNPNYEKIPLVPVEISLRNEIGASVDKDKVSTLPEVLDSLDANAEAYKKAIIEREKTLIFNPGCAAKCGADYILKSLSEKAKAKK